MAPIDRDSIVKRHVQGVELTRQSCDSCDNFYFNKTKEIISQLHPIYCSHYGPTEHKEIWIRFMGGRLMSPVILEHNGDSNPSLYPSECKKPQNSTI